jgi:hypothetical protein
MPKKSASVVLATLRSSTYQKEYAFASSLAAALLDSLFEHPVGCLNVISSVQLIDFEEAHARFSAAC